MPQFKVTVSLPVRYELDIVVEASNQLEAKEKAEMIHRNGSDLGDMVESGDRTYTFEVLDKEKEALSK